MNTKKIVSAVTASSILVLSLSGCSLLNGKSKEAITETALGYIDAVKGGKFNKSLKFVADEEDYFQDHEMDGMQAELVAAVLDASEYEVDNININKNSATADIIFTMPDLESIADEGYSFDEFIEAIGDIDEQVEETVEFEFSKEDDEWFIEGDSTEDFYEFLNEIGEGIEFSGLSESGALAAVDTFISYLADGNLEAAVAMSSDAGNLAEGLEDIDTSLDQIAGLSDVMSAYYSRLDYTSAVTSVTDDSITVLVTGTAPDPEAQIAADVSDVNVMAPIAADYIESMINGNNDTMIMINQVFAIVTDAIGRSGTTDFDHEVVVTVDEDGNYYVTPSEDFGLDFDFPDLISSDEVLPAALDLLLEQGRISEADYATYYAYYVGGSAPASGDEYDTTAVVVEEGSDLFSYDYTVSDSEVVINARTWAYYSEGDVFEYEVFVDGQNTENGQYIIPENNCDMIYVTIPSASASGPYGNYEVVIYDEGANTNAVLIDIEVVVLEQGAPLSGSIVEFEESMTYTPVSDDFYTFHFLDGNGEYMEDDADIYPSNRGSVDFEVRTWGYYDEGDSVACDVFRDGEIVESLVFVSPDDFNDTFTFSYEPSRLENGDYTFVMYDVNSDTILAMAYATVEPVD